MAEMKDSIIKLFGWTIPMVQGNNNKEDGKMDELDTSTKSKDKNQEFPISDEQKHPISSVLKGDARKLLQSEEKAPATDSPEKQPVKKPDKILPCPRCSSLDTKFCYYNNYNVNQPRHFCKNCQRYWTAGGTMRNVPVGAGRRKSKSSHNRHITVTASALQTLCSDGPESVHHLPVSPNGTVLTFGPDRPLCESMASVLNLTEEVTENCNWNTIHQMEETGDEHSSGSSVTGSNSNEEGVGATSQEQMLRNCQAIPTLWPYLWASSAPAFCNPSFPVPFYPSVTAYWGCGIQGTWTVPWIAPLLSPSANASSCLPNSPTLGKHSREGIVLKQCNSKAGEVREKSKQEGRICVPKTLRIDDLEVAAKSSIWASIGIKNDKTDGISRGSLFRAFQDKPMESKDRMSEASQVLCANPAALSRSLNFQES